MSRTDRHTALALVHQAEAQSRATQSAVPWRDINQAIEQHLAHGAAALADPGTDSLLELVLAVPTRHHTGYPTAQDSAMPAPMPTMLPRPPSARITESAGSPQGERVGKAIEEARTAGHADGLRQGYRQGWRWGVACGVVAGALGAGLCWGAWLTVQVPDAVPTASTRLL